MRLLNVKSMTYAQAEQAMKDRPPGPKYLGRTAKWKRNHGKRPAVQLNFSHEPSLTRQSSCIKESVKCK